MSIKSTVLTSLAGLNRYQIDQEKIQLSDQLPLLSDHDALLQFYFEIVMHYGSRWEAAGRTAFEQEAYNFLAGLLHHCDSLPATQS